MHHVSSFICRKIKSNQSQLKLRFSRACFIFIASHWLLFYRVSNQEAVDLCRVCRIPRNRHHIYFTELHVIFPHTSESVNVSLPDERAAMSGLSLAEGKELRRTWMWALIKGHTHRTESS